MWLSPLPTNSHGRSKEAVPVHTCMVHTSSGECVVCRWDASVAERSTHLSVHLQRVSRIALHTSLHIPHLFGHHNVLQGAVISRKEHTWTQTLQAAGKQRRQPPQGFIIHTQAGLLGLLLLARVSHHRALNCREIKQYIHQCNVHTSMNTH